MQDKNFELRCPECGTMFTIDEGQYNNILKQVRDRAFRQELDARVEASVRAARLEQELSAQKAKSASDAKIRELESRLERAEAEKALAVSQAVSDSEREADRLKSELRLARSDAELQLKSQREGYEARLRGKDDEIAFYKDFKARQSTKMIGESLERHCEDMFNQVRAIGFAGDYFEKDNAVSSTGSKGDFIYRSFDADGREIISVMLEMKNEADGTEKKHKNADFFKELDRDRREKGCEYAILVTLLEPDSELYNSGIVDVSHKYPKMYVIRPQFLIPMLTLLRNMARSSSEYRAELARVREQNLDVVRFEEQLHAFQDAFGRNYRIASEKFDTAIAEIDKAIDHLNKIKQALAGSERQLELANRKAEDLSMAKLARNSPVIQAELRRQGPR